MIDKSAGEQPPARKRAEEWAINHLGRMYISQHPAIVDAISAFAEEVRREQREKHARILDAEISEWQTHSGLSAEVKKTAIQACRLAQQRIRNEGEE